MSTDYRIKLINSALWKFPKKGSELMNSFINNILLKLHVSEI